MNEILEVYGENLIEMLGVIAGISLIIVLMINYGETIQQILNGIFI